MSTWRQLRLNPEPGAETAGVEGTISSGKFPSALESDEGLLVLLFRNVKNEKENEVINCEMYISQRAEDGLRNRR